ncbi:ChaN family lipoprotein [Oscillatoria laete-virens NRMC-F 0139]|nr:ChaN family lipoprotein [Oscillatoria laete-virens]MDL5052925.1 ChaN family lipoprotein [Oscillatoria laete-virens NRMC-F 0139]
MAHHIVQFRQAHPDYQVIAIAGQGHIIYGYGIPSRVARVWDLRFANIRFCSILAIAIGMQPKLRLLTFSGRLNVLKRIAT